MVISLNNNKNKSNNYNNTTNNNKKEQKQQQQKMKLSSLHMKFPKRYFNSKILKTSGCKNR